MRSVEYYLLLTIKAQLKLTVNVANECKCNVLSK